MKRIIALSSLVLAIGLMSFVTENTYTKTSNHSDGDKCCVAGVAKRDTGETAVAGACADTYDDACDQAVAKAEKKLAATGGN